MMPEQRAHSDAIAKEMMAEMVLVELRKLTNTTQTELAQKLGIKQPTLSRIEAQDDRHVNTLRRFIEALGGKLELIVHLPEGDIRISQFNDAA
jgi:transcriptional regulator with XRE-family HTH domain